MQVRCRLRDIMDERGITVDALHQRARVGREAIAALRKNNWKLVGRSTMGRVCNALNITLDQLFDLIPEDIWAAVKLSREITIHYGSRTVLESHEASRSGDDAQHCRQYVGVWDMRALTLIWEHLKGWGLDISVRLEEHITGLDRGFDPSVREAVRRVFDTGNHLVIGSPIANQFAESVVCHAYGVAPYAPQKPQQFPYEFVWDSARAVTSSFGRQGVEGKFGIASTRTGELVAQRTVVSDGEGQDCALILVHRIWQPPTRRGIGGEDERVVIAILGHSGVGTYAGAQVAADPICATGLHPLERGKPQLRVVAATYTASPVTPPRDNRQVTSVRLLDDPDGGPLRAATASRARGTRRPPNSRAPRRRSPTGPRTARLVGAATNAHRAR